MITTWFDEAEAKGEVKGAQGIVISLLNHKFGSLPQNVLDHVKTMEPNQLQNLSVKLLNSSYGLKELGLANGVPSK